MAVTQARPDFAAHTRAVRASFPELVSELRSVLGARLVAYLGSVKETRAVRQWADGEREPSEEVRNRLRVALQVALPLAEAESPDRSGLVSGTEPAAGGPVTGAHAPRGRARGSRSRRDRGRTRVPDRRMTPALSAARPGGPLHRVGRAPDAWSWPPWAYAGEDGRFGNRFDDPAGEYRVLYASSPRVGAFLETLARYRTDPALVAASRGSRTTMRTGSATRRFPPAWCRRIGPRRAGLARRDTTARSRDIGQSGSLAHLRSALAGRLVHYGLEDLDGGELRRRAPRASRRRSPVTCSSAASPRTASACSGSGICPDSATTSRTGRSSRGANRMTSPLRRSPARTPISCWPWRNSASSWRHRGVQGQLVELVDDWFAVPVGLLVPHD